MKQNQEWKNRRCTSQMPISLWIVVPAKIRTIDSASSVTVNRSDANGSSRLPRLIWAWRRCAAREVRLIDDWAIAFQHGCHRLAPLAGRVYKLH